MYNKWFYAFWLLPKALLMLVIIALIARKLWKEFPFFLSYAIFQVSEITTILILRPRITYAHYFWTFWAMEAIGTVTAFLVINEIFACALRPYSALKRLSSVLFQWAFLLILGLLTFLCLFIRAFAIPWRHYIFGLTTGFALYRVAELFITAARVHWGVSVNWIMDWGRIGAYNFTVLLWVSYFVLPHSREVSIRYVPGSQLQQWNDPLRGVWQ